MCGYSTSAPVSSPRTQCGTMTFSSFTSSPSLRSSAAVYSTAFCACGEPLKRAPMLFERCAKLAVSVFAFQGGFLNRFDF